MGQWIVGVISFQKMYGLHGLKHHIVEISGDVTDAGQTTSEDSATQLLICEKLSLAIQFWCWRPTAEKPLEYLPETFDSADQISNTPQIKYQICCKSNTKYSTGKISDIPQIKYQIYHRSYIKYAANQISNTINTSFMYHIRVYL